MFSETLRCVSIHCQNFISIEVAVQELGGGWVTQTPSLGQSVGQKQLGRATIKTRSHGGLTQHSHSEAPAGNHTIAMTFARLRLNILLRCIDYDWMPFYLCPNCSKNLYIRTKILRTIRLKSHNSF